MHGPPEVAIAEGLFALVLEVVVFGQEGLEEVGLEEESALLGLGNQVDVEVETVFQGDQLHLLSRGHVVLADLL